MTVRTPPRLLFIGSLILGLSVSSACMTKPRPFESQIVIAHRGASGYRPEHTEIAYRLAVAQGADFIEPDLVPTRDGVLIVRHENELGGTTDVADREEFRHRYTTKEVDGDTISGWFSEDFTLAEIKTLRARERIPDIRPYNTQFDGTQKILTLTEVIDLAKELSSSTGRPIGIYPETKHPTYFKSEGRHIDGQAINFCTSTRLVQVLREQDFVDPTRVYIQSFEIENLLTLKTSIMPEADVMLPLILLFGNAQDCAEAQANSFARPRDVYYHAQQKHNLAEIYGELHGLTELNQSTCYGSLNKPNVLAWLSHTITGVGPWKDNLLNPDYPAPNLLVNALNAGLKIHPYTLRRESEFRSAPGTLATIEEEITKLLDLGVHGFFTDNPNIGVRIRQQWQAHTKSSKKH